MLTQMLNSSSTALNRPISTPSVMPATMASTMPMAKLCSVISAAACQVLVCTIVLPASNTLESGGTRNIRPDCPTSSQIRHQTRRDAIIGSRYP
jgi:hypothetical protein